MLPKLTFILGGASSGKTAFAETLTRDHAQLRGKLPTYLATAQIFDAEMQAKVDAHRASRSQGWHSIESPYGAARELLQMGTHDTVLLDCATLWLSNQMLSHRDLATEINALLQALTTSQATIIVVSNEVGQGIVPDHKLGRQFRDAQGKLNQRIAAVSDLALLLVAGLPLVLKGTLP